MPERLHDAPESSGVMVALVLGLDESAVLIQAGTTRYTLTPAEARGLASSLAYTAGLIETGTRPPGGEELPIDAPSEDIARATRRNRRSMPS